MASFRLQHLENYTPFALKTYTSSAHETATQLFKNNCINSLLAIFMIVCGNCLKYRVSNGPRPRENLSSLCPTKRV